MPSQTPITLQQVSSTRAYVESLDTDAKLKSFDQIFEAQSAVMGAVVQLKLLGVESAAQEHAFQILLILFECFAQHVPNLPRISEKAVQKALDNNVSMREFLEKESPEEAARLQRLSIEKYPEPNILAYVTGYLNDNGLSKFCRGNELVVHTCKSIMDAFVQAKQQSAE
jgi:hypothetical protein